MTGFNFSGLRLRAREVEGFTICGISNRSNSVRGVNLAGVTRTREMAGLTAGVGNIVSDHQVGISLGLVNYATKIFGVQIGLINYIKENPKWFKLLPLINFNFNK